LKLLKRAIPTTTLSDVVWDLQTGLVYFCNTSEALRTKFAEIFENTFEHGVVERHTYSIALDVLASSSEGSGAAQLAALNPVNLVDDKPLVSDTPSDTVALIEAKQFIGREFLTWLWFKSTVGKITPDIEVHNALSLDSPGGEETIACRGEETSKFEEGKKALRQGKKVNAARLILHNDSGFDFIFTLGAKVLRFNACKLPKVSVDREDAEGVLLEKIYLVKEVELAVDRAFGTFLRERLSDAFIPEFVIPIKEWMFE